VSHPLPPLPRPQYAVIGIGCSSEVPAQIADDLQEIGIPAGAIGYEYRPLSEAAFLAGIGESGLVAFGTSGLFGRIGIDVATRRVVQIPRVDSTTCSHVNKDLSTFHRCIAAMIARFPFYEEDEEEIFQVVADELHELIAALDDTAFADDGFWETLCDDMAIGDYPSKFLRGHAAYHRVQP